MRSPASSSCTGISMLEGKEKRMTVNDGEWPFYTAEEPPVRLENAQSSSNVMQGPGSGFDADTIQGLQAVTAFVAGPNKLVATGSDGKLPASVIP